MNNEFQREINAIRSSFSTAKFTSGINDELRGELYGIVYGYIKKRSGSKVIAICRLQEGWEEVKIGQLTCTVGLFMEDSTSRLVVAIERFGANVKRIGCAIAKGVSSRKVKVRQPGRIRGIALRVSDGMNLDIDHLGQLLRDCIEHKYLTARYEFKGAMLPYVTRSRSDALYDVMKVAGMDELIPNITLYSVFGDKGRHLPSVDRLVEIVPRMSSSIYGGKTCPLSLASNFFLGHLDAGPKELYTQLAFREDRVMLAKGDKYSGQKSEDDIRIPTEAFFGKKDVKVHPLACSGDDKMLLSAIYPAELAGEIQKRLEQLRPRFLAELERSEKDARDVLGKLNALFRYPAPAGEDFWLKFWSYVGALGKGFLEG